MVERDSSFVGVENTPEARSASIQDIGVHAVSVPFVPFDSGVSDETSKLLRERSTGQSDCEPTLFFQGFLLGCGDELCEGFGELCAGREREEYWGRGSVRHVLDEARLRFWRLIRSAWGTMTDNMTKARRAVCTSPNTRIVRNESSQIFTMTRSPDLRRGRQPGGGT